MPKLLERVEGHILLSLADVEFGDAAWHKEAACHAEVKVVVHDGRVVGFFSVGGLALMKTKRREIEGLSLSFLDVISCGFGALILLLVLTKVFDPSDIKVSIGNLEDYLISLQEDILTKRNDNRELRTEIIRRQELGNEEMLRVTRLQEELLQLQEKYEIKGNT